MFLAASVLVVLDDLKKAAGACACIQGKAAAAGFVQQVELSCEFGAVAVCSKVSIQFAFDAAV